MNAFRWYKNDLLQHLYTVRHGFNRHARNWALDRLISDVSLAETIKDLRSLVYRVYENSPVVELKSDKFEELIAEMIVSRQKSREREMRKDLSRGLTTKYKWVPVS